MNFKPRLLPYMQQVVDALWMRLDEIGQIEGKHIWQPLEKYQPRPAELLSRLWRGILERAGRTLRAQAERKRVFDLLLSLLKAEYFANGDDGLLKLTYRLRAELGDNREKLGYLLNLIEQAADFYTRNDRLPTNYDELRAKPSLKTAWLPFAADDGPAEGPNLLDVCL